MNDPAEPKTAEDPEAESKAFVAEFDAVVVASLAEQAAELQRRRNEASAQGRDPKKVKKEAPFFPSYFNPEKIPAGDRQIWERLKKDMPRRRFDEWRIMVENEERRLRGDVWNDPQHRSSRACFLEFVIRSVENFAKTDSDEPYCRLKAGIVPQQEQEP